MCTRFLLKIVLLVLLQQNVFGSAADWTKFCKYEAADIADDGPVVGGKCKGVSVTIDQRPIPMWKQMGVSVPLKFSASISKDKPYTCVSLMYDHNNARVPNCAPKNLSTLKEIAKSCGYMQAFNRSKRTAETYSASLDCLQPELQPGNYCVFLQIDTVDCPPIYSKMKELEQVTEVVDDPPVVDDGLPFPYVVVIAVLISLMVAGTVIYFLIKRGVVNRFISGGMSSGAFTTRQKMFKELKSKPLVPLFFLYYPDCPHHVDVVEKLAAFLERNQCSVSYDAIEKDSMARNPAGWLQWKLKGDFKIVVVNSRGAFDHQRMWMNRASVEKRGGDDSWSSDSIFLMALANISTNPKLAFDYDRTFMLRPSYVPLEQLLSGITPNRHYELAGNLAEFLRRLHNLDPSWTTECGSDDEWQHCRSAYSDLLNAMEPLQPDEIDGTRCRLCAARSAACRRK